jgi:hypothetical protein
MAPADPQKLGFHREGSLQADSRGRLTIGRHLKAQRGPAAGYALYVNDAGQIMLDPVVEIPQREQWLYRNKLARKALEAGLISAATETPVDLGSFAKHADDDPDE